MKKRSLRSVTALLAFSVAASCLGPMVGLAQAADKKRVAFVTGQINDPFYALMQKGAQKKADEIGVQLDYQGATVWDPLSQIPIVDAVRITAPDFLIMVPVEQTALVAPIQNYASAGIPVITVDTDLADPSARLINISSDNVGGGELVADTLAKAVGEKGKVTILCYQPGITVDDQRLAGFAKSIAKHPGVEYVGPQLMASTDQTESARYFGAVLQANPDLAGVAVCDGVAASGVMTSMKEKGLAGKIKLVGFDVNDDLLAGVSDGSIAGLAVQKTEEMGATAVSWANDYLNGKNPPKQNILLPFVMVTKDNIADPEVKKIVSQ